MDEREVRRHVAVLEDRIDQIAETQDEILGCLDSVSASLDRIYFALMTPPETGEPEETEIGRAH